MLLQEVIGIALAAIGVAVALSLGLGTRGLAGEIVAGVYLRDLLKEGDRIEWNGIAATVRVVNIPWYEYPDLRPDPQDFARRVEQEAGDKTRPILLICRSGKRTLDAGAALEAAGFTDVAHVVHGFEGELDEHFHRSSVNGWRFEGLPWEQM